MTIESLIRPLTIITVFGLLLSVGLRVSAAEVVESTKDRGLLARSVLANFVLAPLAIVGVAVLFSLSVPITIGIVIIAASPFAPMAPAFAGMANGNLPLAAGHMVIYSVLAVVVTPVLCRLFFLAIPGTEDVAFNLVAILISLILTVFLPLFLGLGLQRISPRAAARLLRPVSVASFVILIAAVVLIFIDQFPDIAALDWQVFAAMILGTELSFAIGYVLGGPDDPDRRSIALGTAMRNIGVAILIATGSFADSPALLSVLVFSLVVVILGLIHAMLWSRRAPSAYSSTDRS